MPMINIRTIVRHYLPKALKAQWELHPDDTCVIKAIRNPAHPGREQILLEWLTLYQVFRIHGDMHLPIARAIFDYAHVPRNNQWRVSRRNLVNNFEALYAEVSRAAVHPETGKTYKLVSLTSKALWCISPTTVPIYDSRVWNAARILSRLSGLDTSRKHDYAGFVDMWYRLYRLAKPYIDARKPDKYPYEIRIFDKILWLIG